MGVRVRIRIRSASGPTLDTSCFLNSGFEEEPTLLLPVEAARRLELWPKLPEGACVRSYDTAGGSIRMPYVREGVELLAVEERTFQTPIKLGALISQIEREVAASDEAIDKMGIVIESAGGGLWRFKNESNLRKSVEPQFW